jgi:phosphate transport system substrate-binding protein
MKQFILIALVLAAGSGCHRPEEPSTTRGKAFILVSGSYLPLIKEEAAEYMRTYTEVDIQMAGTTTREAIVQLLNDSVRCICVDRELNDEEGKVVADAGIRIATVRIGKDALVLVVNQDNPLKSVKLATVKGILDGSLASWKKVPGSRISGSIELVLMGRNSGAYELLQKKFFQLSKDLTIARVGTSEREIVQYVGLNPQAMGIVSLAAVVDQPKRVRVLQVQPSDTASHEEFVQPSQSNIYDSLYPLNYSLYLYLSEKQLGVGSGFSTFVMTLPGQKIIQDYGLVPEKIPNRIIQLKSE